MKFTVILRVIVMIMAIYTPFISKPDTAHAALDTNMVTINGGGGVQTDGSDGIMMTFNIPSFGEQVKFINQNFIYSGGDVSFHLNIGGTLYTAFRGSSASRDLSNSAKFDDLVISDLTGTASTAGGSTTGDGSVVMTYSKDIGGLIYEVKRTITYTYPNQYYTDQFDVTIPTGNTAVVKLYKGGDTAPGGSDSGRAMYLTSPVRNIQSVEATAGVVFGMKEIAQETDMSTFEGAVGQNYTAPYATVLSGGDIGFYAQPGPSTHDVGFMIQYNIGDDPSTPTVEAAAPGTYREENYTYLGFQAVNIEAEWASPIVRDVGRLNITVTNAYLATKDGLGFTFTFPPNLVIGNISNGCGASISFSGLVMTITGISIAELSSCLIAVDVGRTSAGTSTISSASVTGLVGDGLKNAVGSSTVQFLRASSTFTPTPSRTPLPPTNTATVTSTATPTNTATPTFTPTPHPFAIKDVAVGASFTLAVLNNGTLVTWGFNREGQASLPRWMATKPVKEVEVGSNYAIALGEDGRVYGWGANEFKQLNIPRAALSGVKTISASLGHVMAIKSNGSLLIWGRNDFKQTKPPKAAQKNLIAVGAGHSHSLAVKKDGTVLAWGRNTWGQTRVPKGLKQVIAVAGGFDHSLALRKNGTIVCWGRNNEDQCKIPVGLKDVIAISAGVGYSMALTRDGDVYAWGRNNYGQAKVPTDLSPVGAIASGYVNSVVGMRDANVRAFGNGMLDALVSRTPTIAP